MRERLIAAFVGFTFVVVALYGVPRAYIVADQVQQSEERKIERSLEVIAVLLAERAERGADIDPDYLAGLLNEAERIEYTEPNGAVVIGAAPTASPSVGPGDIVRTTTLSDGARVSLSRSNELIERRISEAIMPVALLGIALIGGALLVGFVLARRLARPFQQLAAVADEFGKGRLDVPVPSFSVPEADNIARALRNSQDSLRELVRREHDFAVNASHQLRTPVTALRLELEDLSLWPETPEAVAEELSRALSELDRLSGTVDELLDLARGERLSAVADVDVCSLVQQSIDRWAPIATAERRALEACLPAARVTVVAPAGPVQQILDILIENAIRHGAGSLVITVVDHGGHAEISVADEGDRPTNRGLFVRSERRNQAVGEGIGLALAQELAEAIGGRLVLTEAPTTTFALLVEKPVLSGR